MASTKSTVVGIRLDHERRAWVEAEAARLGVSVRGLFEGMIDEARSGGSGAAAGTDVESRSTARPAEGQPREGAASRSGSEEKAAGATSDGVHTDASSTRAGMGAGRAVLSDLGSIAALPGELLRGACSLTVGLIESSSRCAIKRLGGCALTRHRGDGSV